MNARTTVDETAEKIELEAGEAALPVPATVAAAPPPVRPKRRGRSLRVLLMLIVPLVLAAGGGYYWATGGRVQETDNANVRQARVNIASQVAGRVVEVDVSENGQVKAGDVLFVVDPEPYRIALSQAESAVASARLNVEQLRAAYAQAMAQEKISAGDVAYFQGELDRQSALTAKAVGTRQALDSARRDLEKAEDEHQVAVEAIDASKAALGGDPAIETDRHPAVLAALATRDQQAYQLAQTTVKAPADGTVSQAASFKAGQYVGPGTALFSLVETGDTWIEANFKETQLTNMKLGQKAEIVLDTFPDRTLEGTVDSIGPGTGAEFSVLPAQNATGNWVKVTQRVPVRVKVTSEDADMLMRTGMSATVAIDTGVSRGLPKLVADLIGKPAVAAE